MPITATFPTITFPHRGVESKDTFVLSQETAQDLLAGSFTANLNTFKTEANALESNVNAKEASAVAASATAVSAANYQGDWVSQGYTQGQSVSYLGNTYTCKLTHTTAQTPTNTTYWNPTGLGATIHSSDEKTTPVDADELGIWDSVTTSLNRMSFVNFYIEIKTRLTTFFDVRYDIAANINSATTEDPGSTDTFGYYDSFTGLLRKVTVTNLISVFRSTLDSVYANLVSPVFTGTPTAPTASAGTNTTQIATTAFVQGQSFEKIGQGTAQPSTSGYSINFTGIPSWVKKIKVQFVGVSTTGSSPIIVQIGSGSIQTTGYSSAASSGTATAFASNGFAITNGGSSSNVVNGEFEISSFTLGTYTGFGCTTQNISTNAPHVCAGSVAISGTIDRVTITTAGGSDTFDSGAINIMYEG